MKPSIASAHRQSANAGMWHGFTSRSRAWAPRFPNWLKFEAQVHKPHPMSGVVRDDYYDSDNKNIAARTEKEGFRI